MELAREAGAGAKTESSQAEGIGLRGGHPLWCGAGPGQDGNASSGKRLCLGPQSRKHFRVGTDRRGQELYRIGPGPESLSRRLLGSLLRAAALLRELALARADGSLRHFLARLGPIDVLVIDDWAMAPLNENERREVWEICEDRYQTRSTILTSQLPVSRWHEQIGDPTIADGILDRLVHNAHRIEMRGESMRKKRNRRRTRRRNEPKPASGVGHCSNSR
jgi:IstB-like ATP binding protein